MKTYLAISILISALGLAQCANAHDAELSSKFESLEAAIVAVETRIYENNKSYSKCENIEGVATTLCGRKVSEKALEISAERQNLSYKLVSFLNEYGAEMGLASNRIASMIEIETATVELEKHNDEAHRMYLSGCTVQGEDSKRCKEARSGKSADVYMNDYWDRRDALQLALADIFEKDKALQSE